MTTYIPEDKRLDLIGLMRMRVKDDEKENVYYLKPVNRSEEVYHIKRTTCIVSDKTIRLEGDERSKRKAHSFLELKLGIKLLKNV